MFTGSQVLHYVVLLAYDHLLTLDLEVRYIWKSWRTRASAWYLIIRYSSLCIRAMVLLTFNVGSLDLEVCSIRFGQIDSHVLRRRRIHIGDSSRLLMEHPPTAVPDLTLREGSSV
jgi:hypothetical protein